MTRQDQFKQELFALLRKYRVEMSVEEDKRGYADAIAFWSYTTWDDTDGEIKILEDKIDFSIGTWTDGKE